jgi:hypothetical protein
MRQLCGTVLIMEAIVIGLAIPVAIPIGHTAPRVAGRPGLRWALVAGSALQLCVIAAGALVPVMYALGIIFAGFWVLAIWMGRRWEAP